VTLVTLVKFVTLAPPLEALLVPLEALAPPLEALLVALVTFVTLVILVTLRDSLAD